MDEKDYRMQRFLLVSIVIATLPLMMFLSLTLAGCQTAGIAPVISVTDTAAVDTPTAGETAALPSANATPSPQAQVEQSATAIYLPHISKPSATPIPTPFPTPPPGTLRESFEGAEGSWQVQRETAGSGTVQLSNARAVDGSASARAATGGANGKAQLQLSLSEPATSHAWNERPGTYYWQNAMVYVPSTTLANLGANGYLTLAGIYPSAGGAYGWWLRVRQNGSLFVYGYTADGNPVEFQAYASLPRDTWFSLEIGLHSQNGPGVKRAFAFLIDGAFYGWYHQGHMQDEVYNRAAIGILSTSSGSPLEVFVDRWMNPTTALLPSGPDKRPTADVQEHDFRLGSGEMWQIDWSTWANDLRLDASEGIYSAVSRLQSGRNIDRMPDLTSGWGEIEIGLPGGKAPASPCNGAMIAFRKEVNREENLEIIPVCQSNGTVKMVLEAWVNGGPQVKQQWQMPIVPAAGDILRARWQQVDANNIDIDASYFDASANQWYNHIIKYTLNGSNVAGINFNDGYHKASSITIDTPAYSIRRFKFGVLSTYPGP